MRAVERESVVALAMLLAFATIPSCSIFKPVTPEEVNDFGSGAYPDSRTRADCVREADKVLERTGPTGDMYDETRRQMRSDLIGQCMKKRAS